jgi:hypothetical protein
MKSIFGKKIRLIELNFPKSGEEDMTCKEPRREKKSAYTHVASLLLQNRREF